MLEWLRKLFCTDIYPVWAYGLECEICKTTFVSAEAHQNYVQNKNLLGKHENKIPVLRCR